MSKKRIILYSVLVALVVGLFFYRSKLEEIYLSSQQKITDFRNNAVGLIAQKVEKNVSTPPPLRSPKDSPNAVLTKAGAIQWTNNNRRQNGLSSLTENQRLDQAALDKAQDMFTNQYFEHISPSGKGPQDLDTTAGYEYISIGENLALGNFANDRELLDAWMASPGHRANILNKGFSEIGVAVVAGNYEGHQTWIAVQEFGAPVSLCLTIDSSAKADIDVNNKKISDLSSQLDALKKEINQSKAGSPSLSRKTDEYNSLAGQYNSLVAKTKKMIENYNAQVAKFNDCAKSHSE